MSGANRSRVLLAAVLALLLLGAVVTASFAASQPPAPEPSTEAVPEPQPSEGVEGGFTESFAQASGSTHRNFTGAPGVEKVESIDVPSAPRRGAKVRSASISSVEIENDEPEDDVKVRTELCDDMALTQCSSARAGCIVESGNPNFFEVPTITWVSVNGGGWDYSGLSCGSPDSVTLPGAGSAGPGGAGPGAVRVAVQAPPTPSFAQVQEAFRELPFAKPRPSIQPVGLRTLKNLPTYYAVDWPDEGLSPGEVSQEVRLLSWRVEFKVAAKDYRYNFGDGSASGWTASTGGVYPDGDVRHTYEQAASVDVSVDARLTGQYRVNGGEWRDIATVADLQDEPSSTLEVLATRTRLVDH